jgi:hypothetical protein
MVSDKKKWRIRNWKKYGLIGDYETIYDRYINTNNCDLCNVFLEGIGRNRKCMDHDHENGEFRNIVCHACNLKKTDKKIPINNKSGYKHIQYCKRKNLWVYDRNFNNKRIRICRKTKIDILCIKFAGILLYKY